MPEKAKNSNERTLRKKRINFYEKNGAYITNYGWSAFKVEYNLLVLPISESDFSSVNFGEEIYNMYLSSFEFPFRFLAKKNLKCWKNDKNTKL